MGWLRHNALQALLHTNLVQPCAIEAAERPSYAVPRVPRVVSRSASVLVFPLFSEETIAPFVLMAL